MASQPRYSNFELMRLFCMFGIIAMHSCVFLFKNPSNGMLLELDAINTVFNTGVTLFILISGYFGINTNPKKIFRFWIQVVFCSVLSCVIISLVHNSISLKSVIYSITPILSCKYWFATSYLVLMVLAPILNKATEALSQVSLKKVILYCLVLFSLLPSLFFFSIPGTGKGVLHFIMIYIIGRYIALYMPNLNISKKKLLTLLSVIFFIIFIINYISTVVYNAYFNRQIVFFPMSRDCSILILVASLFIFLLFKSCKIKSARLNKVASHVFCMYLMEESFRNFLNMYIRLEDYASVYMFPFALTCYVLLIMGGCVVTGILQKCVCMRIENWIWPVIERRFLTINK